MGKILVTGATGFTGSNVCRRLRASGEEVVAFVRESPRVEPLKAMGVEFAFPTRTVHIASAPSQAPAAAVS